MLVIKVSAWKKDIALVTETENKIAFELKNRAYICFSPLMFENTLYAEAKTGRGEDINEIGIVADSISGAYGKRYFDKYFINEFGTAPSILDRLSFIGKHGLGALEFEPSNTSSNINTKMIFSLSEFKKQSLDVYEGRGEGELGKLIARSNSGAGGAKAKAVVDYDPTEKKIQISQKHDEITEGYCKCIVKFNSKRGSEAEIYNTELKLEYIYYLLAEEAGINISESWLESDSEDNYCFITKRFDIDAKGKRLHMHSLAGLLSHDASSFSMGYESLFRVGNMLSVSKADKEQMFKTMVFNLVFANRDDHSRNFSFLMDENCSWSYAPAYDLTYSASNHHLDWHQLTIDKKPAHKVRTLAMSKIAKLCDVSNPLEVLSDMIKIKESRLRELAKKYGVNEVVSQIFNDTADFDKIFRNEL
ncbi:MAG: HipA domain-containing protein [Campylobacterota bacterium]|nr:HipA domain-containing protein [Campylobacterota bacterium]